MTVLLRVVDGAFDLIFRPFHAVHPVYGLGVISFLTGAAAVLVFRYASNQEAMRRIKNRIQAHVLEVRLFPDQPGVVLRAYGRILRFTLVYLAYTLKPVLILLLPIVILMGQLSLRFSRMPLRPHDSFVLKVKLSEPLTLDSHSLRLPPGLTLTAPPVNIPALREVDWRIRADKDGDFSPAIVIAGQPFTKRVTVSGDIERLPPERVRASVLAWFLDPGEPFLPRRGPLRGLEVNYAPRVIGLGYFETDWLIFFLVVSLVSGLIFKVLLRIEL